MKLKKKQVFCVTCDNGKITCAQAATIIRVRQSVITVKTREFTTEGREVVMNFKLKRNRGINSYYTTHNDFYGEFYSPNTYVLYKVKTNHWSYQYFKDRGVI